MGASGGRTSRMKVPTQDANSQVGEEKNQSQAKSFVTGRGGSN